MRNIIKIASAFIGVLVGAGFASGQEQYGDYRGTRNALRHRTSRQDDKETKSENPRLFHTYTLPSHHSSYLTLKLQRM